MSISCAPASTARRTSSMRTWSGNCPLGNAVATDATFTELPRSASHAVATSAGYTQIAATDGIVGSNPGNGEIALRHSARTFSGESLPSSVVRSIIDTPNRRSSSLVLALIERFVKLAARRSTITLSTVRSMGRSKCGTASEESTRVTAINLHAQCGRVREGSGPRAIARVDRLQFRSNR